MNKTQLNDWLRGRVATMRSPIARAVYAGLITRIERGEFDEVAR